MVNEWTAHAHAFDQRHEEWARQPNRRRVLNYGEWARREERLAQLHRRDEVLRQWAADEADQLRHVLPFVNSELALRRLRLIEDLALEMPDDAPSFEAWLMARYPRAWCRAAGGGSVFSLAFAGLAAPLSLLAAWDAWERRTPWAATPPPPRDDGLQAWWRLHAAGRLLCAAWAGAVALLQLARLRRARASARARGALAACRALHAGPRGAPPLERRLKRPWAACGPPLSSRSLSGSWVSGASCVSIGMWIPCCCFKNRYTNTA